MSKRYPDLECETKFRIPAIKIPACALLIYFIKSGVSTTSSGAIYSYPIADKS